MKKLLYFCIIIEVVLQNVSAQINLNESPCPEILRYDSTETNKWHGTIFIRSDSRLYGVYVDIILDKAAESIENSLGDVETFNNVEYKLKNRNEILNENTLLYVTITVKYNRLSGPPKIRTIRLNGRQICTGITVNSTRPQSGSQNHRNTNEYSTSNRNYDQVYSSNPRNVNEYSTSNRNVDQVYSSNSRNNNEPLPLGVNDSFNNRQNDYSRENTRSSTNYNEVISYKPSHPTTQRPASYYPSSNTDTMNRRTYENSNTGTYNNNGRNTFQTNPTDRTNNRYATSTTQKTTYRQHDRFDSEYDDGGSSAKRDRSNDYFEGDFRLRPESKISPTPLPRRNSNSDHACGVVSAQPTPLIVGGQTTTQAQWPWHVAIYQSQTVDSKYICGGSLITSSHVITAAHCVTRKNTSRLVNAQTLTIYLGKFNLRKSSDSVQIMLVRRIFVHPEYNATNFYADLAVLKLTKPSDYTLYVRPVCLWKETETELSNVIEKEGTVVGWGFDEDGLVTEELTLVKMPVVKQSTCLWSFSEFYTHFTSEKSYCAGYENGTSVCNGDSGGGMVFPEYDYQGNLPVWRLRGLVSISVAKQNEYKCDPYHYVVFTDLAQFLDWINEKLTK